MMRDASYMAGRGFFYAAGSWLLIVFFPKFPLWISVLCGALFLVGAVPCFSVADERFATTGQVKWTRRVSYVVLVLSTVCLVAAAFRGHPVERGLVALAGVTGLVYVFALRRLVRAASFRPPSALLCTALEKRYLHRAALWQRFLIVPDANVYLGLFFGASLFFTEPKIWRNWSREQLLAAVVAWFFALILSVWMRSRRDTALAAATEQARYRYGTVGEVLHPAHMSVLDRIVPAHIRQ